MLDIMIKGTFKGFPSYYFRGILIKLSSVDIENERFSS